jgi:tRNA A37 methylthiotransferase MiaB
MAQIDMTEIKRRSKKVTDLLNNISLENNKKWIGWEGKVLFDENLDGQIKGRNFAYKPIFVDEEVEIGQSESIRIIDATNHSLIGEIVS